MFGKFMNKKFFHPSSYPNQKQKWIHQQRADAKEKMENEKQETYQKEQESYQSRLLSAKTKDEKLKLDLNFLYDIPPGMRMDNASDEEKEEVKFEWQKSAPRSKYLKDLGLACQDQPFGICVKNIRCFKCKQWGHQNTDRECPLFFSNITDTDSATSKNQAESLRLSDPLRLISDMKNQHGLALKKSVIGQEIDPMVENNQLLESDDETGNANEYDVEYISSLSNKEKKKLLKALDKFDKLSESKKKKKKRKRHASESSDKGKNGEEIIRKQKHKSSQSENSSRRDEEIIYKKKRKSSQSENSSRRGEEIIRKKKRKSSQSEYSDKNEEMIRKLKNESSERRSKKGKRHRR